MELSFQLHHTTFYTRIQIILTIRHIDHVNLSMLY